MERGLMLTLNKGTKENVLVSLDDILDNVTDVMPFTPQYEVVSEWEPSEAYGEIPLTACTEGPTPMSVFCFVDTDDLNSGRYALFVKINNPPENPIIGPVRFKVE
jgi:hypothetical protein